MSKFKMWLQIKSEVSSDYKYNFNLWKYVQSAGENAERTEQPRHKNHSDTKNLDTK